MNPSQLSVMVVIVNYRTPAMVIDCLRSLEPQISQYSNATVTVVDNASGDNSVGAIAAAIHAAGWSSWVTLLCSPINGGFSYGNNFAIRPALSAISRPDCFWLLNPDTVARPNALRALSDFMQTNPEAAICGSGIDFADGTPWPCAFRFPSILSEFERAFAFGPVTWLCSRWVVSRHMGDVPERADWVSGASMMVRREVFETVGLMDEDYFLYFEETDYCLQAKSHNFQCWYVPQGRITHITGQSTGVTARTDQPKRLPTYWFASRRRYFIKNHGRLYAAVADMAWMLAYQLGRLRCWLQRKRRTSIPNNFADFVSESAMLTSHIAGRVTRD